MGVVRMIAYNSLLCLAVLVVVGDGCNTDCGEDMVCTDNLQGYYDSECVGFLGCVNDTTPCAGICTFEYPVLSNDGLSCTNCTEAGECPRCWEDEVWCGVEGLCKARTYLVVGSVVY